MPDKVVAPFPVPTAVETVLTPGAVMSGFSQLSPVRGPPELKLAKLEKADWLSAACDVSVSAPADETDRFLYSAGLLVCLPNGLSDTPSAGTGAVMRSSTFNRYAHESGFSKTSIVDQIEPIIPVIPPIAPDPVMHEQHRHPIVIIARPGGVQQQWTIGECRVDIGQRIGAGNLDEA